MQSETEHFALSKQKLGSISTRQHALGLTRRNTKLPKQEEQAEDVAAAAAAVAAERLGGLWVLLWWSGRCVRCFLKCGTKCALCC